MALTMIDPASSWFEIVELPVITRQWTINVKGRESLNNDEIFDSILAGKYLAKYRDSLIQLFADVSGDRRSLGSFATSSQMMTEGKSHTW